jgi:hypothetical protein
LRIHFVVFALIDDVEKQLGFSNSGELVRNYSSACLLTPELQIIGKTSCHFHGLLQSSGLRSSHYQTQEAFRW